MLLFARRAGIELLHVPFPNSTQMYTAMMSGDVPLGFAFTGPVEAQYRSGQLIALAVSPAHRSPLRPGVPTLAESGYPGFDVTGWSGISTTGGTPAATLETIQRAFVVALAFPEIRDMLATSGGRPIGSSPPAFTREVGATLTRWAPIMRELFPPAKD
ncbi:MAG: tripartite tricarboxylate transporter substrate-binding protein [Casimicrobiaceae bacterium]